MPPECKMAKATTTGQDALVSVGSQEVGFVVVTPQTVTTPVTLTVYIPGQP